MTMTTQKSRGGFFRRREPTQVDDTCAVDCTISLALPNQPHSARAGFLSAHVAALQIGPDARLYLIIADEVDASGMAPAWQYHYVFPAGRCGAVITTSTSRLASRSAQLHERVVPFPEPGTTEDVLTRIGGPYMAHMLENTWQERLSRLACLPVDFYDSPAAINTMLQGDYNPFGGGPARIKGRTPPAGVPVWEVVTSTGVIQATFAPGLVSDALR